MSTEDPRADLRWGSVPALVAEVADRLGDAEALVDGDVRRTFAGAGDGGGGGHRGPHGLGHRGR